MKNIIFKRLVVAVVVFLMGAVIEVQALTLSEANREISQISGIEEVGNLATTAYVNSRNNGVAPVDAVANLFANGGVRTQINNTTGQNIGATGDGSHWVQSGNEWRRVEGSQNLTFQNMTSDNVPINGNRYTLSSVADNSNVRPLSNGALQNAVQEFQQLGDADADVHNGSSQMGNSQEQDNPESMGTEAAATNSGTSNAAGSTTCAQEGLEGVDFLVFHGPLVPCGINKQCANSGDRENDISVPCTLCHFIILIKNVFDLLLSLIITASLFMLTVAGVMYIVSSGGQLTGMAKGIIEKTLLGFGVFLLSWLLVYTLLNMLSVRDTVVGKGSRATWFQFECDTESQFHRLPEVQTPNPTNEGQQPNPTNEGQQPNPTNEGQQPNPTNEGQEPNPDVDNGANVDLQGVAPSDITPYPQSMGQLSASEVRARRDLVSDSGNNIAIWESGIGRTDIETLRPETRQGILSLQNAVGRKIIVTGGAEASGPHTDGTYSHANGYKADIEDDLAVNNYIINNYQYLGRRAGDGARVYTDGNNNYMAREGSHWDASFNRPIPVPLQ